MGEDAKVRDHGQVVAVDLRHYKRVLAPQYPPDHPFRRVLLAQPDQVDVERFRTTGAFLVRLSRLGSRYVPSMFCEGCGAPFDDLTLAFCPECGSPREYRGVEAGDPPVSRPPATASRRSLSSPAAWR